jgi:hypothetical protein
LTRDKSPLFGQDEDFMSMSVLELIRIHDEIKCQLMRKSILKDIGGQDQSQVNIDSILNNLNKQFKSSEIENLIGNTIEIKDEESEELIFSDI